MNKPFLSNGLKRPNLLIAAILVYLVCGIFTESRLLQMKPLATSLLEDFRFYERALDEALSGGDPYRIREIGPAFLYPPPALLIIEPFRIVSNSALRAGLLIAVNIVLVVLIVLGICSIFRISVSRAWYLFPLALGFAPFLELLHVGQINVFSLAGLALVFLYGKRAPAWAGFGLALAMWTKVSPVVMFVYLLGSRQYRALAWTGLFGCVFFFAALMRYGWAPFEAYPDVLSNLLKIFPDGSNSMTFVSKLFPEGTSQETYARAQAVLQLYGAMLISLAALATYFRGAPRELLFVVTCIIMAISPNVMWYHHFVFLLLPVLVLICWGDLHPRLVLLSIGLLLLTQLDRFNLGKGLFVHIAFHLLAIALVIIQIQPRLAAVFLCNSAIKRNFLARSTLNKEPSALRLPF